MFTRLLWKEFRVFWPIWLCVALGGAAIQAFVATVMSREYRYFSDYAFIALCFALVYACATGAAAFAAEREMNTLGLLDSFGLPRGTLWLAKAGFAMASTLLMALTLLGLARVVSPGSPWGADIRPVTRHVSMGVMLVLSLVAWGLLWSAMSRSSLTAAVGTILSVSVMVLFVGQLNRADEIYEASNSFLPPIGTWHIAYGLLALAALFGSYRIMRRGPHHRSIADVDRGAEPETRGDTPEASRPIVKGWAMGFRRLLWTTYRENLWAWVAGFAFLGLLGFWWLGSAPLSVQINGPLTFVVTFCSGLCAGVNLFGSENRRGRRRFLAAHGANPSAIWLAKILPALLLFVPTLAIALNLRHPGDRPWLDEPTLHGNVMAFANAFAVSALLGMLCERGITALALSTVSSILIVYPQAFLASRLIIEPWQYVVVPLAVLGVGWAWRHDWLLERPGSGRWLRLARHTAIATAILLASLMIHRAISIPSLDVYAAELEPATLPDGPADRDARPILEKLRLEARAEPLDSLLPPQIPFQPLASDATIEHGWNDKSELLRPWLKANAPRIALLREASKKDFLSPIKGPDGNVIRSTGMDRDIPSTWALLVDVRERENRKDLQGAWDSLETAVRLGRLLQDRQPLDTTLHGFNSEMLATRLMMDWAFAPSQTLDSLRRALASYRNLKPPPDPAETVRLALREEELAEIDRKRWSEEARRGRADGSSIDGPWYGAPGDFLIETFHRLPSEAERRRRLTLLKGLLDLNKVQIPISLYARVRQRKVHQYFASSRTAVLTITYDQLNQMLANTHVERYLERLNSFPMAVAECQVTRAALPMVLAVAAYKVKHGRMPEYAQDILSVGLIDAIPLDPYTGGPLGYYPAPWDRRTRPLTRIDETFTRHSQTDDAVRYLVSSVGPDLVPQWDRESGSSIIPRDDIEFLLP